MKTNLLTTLITFCLLSFDNADNSKIFKKLYTLEGTWVKPGKRGPVYEEWTKIDKNLLAGRSYTLRNNKDTIVSEHIQLRHDKTGIWYIPTVVKQNNGQPVYFKLKQAKAKSYFFENPEHDFPKRIVYNLVTKDSLHVYIDAGAGTGKQINFNFKRQ